jgi:hypothetical protein
MVSRFGDPTIGVWPFTWGNSDELGPVLLRSDREAERHDGDHVPVANRDADGDAARLHLDQRTDRGDRDVWSGGGDDGADV